MSICPSVCQVTVSWPCMCFSGTSFLQAAQLLQMPSQHLLYVSTCLSPLPLPLNGYMGSCKENLAENVAWNNITPPWVPVTSIPAGSNTVGDKLLSSLGSESTPCLNLMLLQLWGLLWVTRRKRVAALSSFPNGVKYICWADFLPLAKEEGMRSQYKYLKTKSSYCVKLVLLLHLNHAAH